MNHDTRRWIARLLIGLVGESLLLVSLPSGNATLGESVLRFILFDAAGLVLLGIAWWLVRREAAEGIDG